jgi:hypothetical protein
LIQSIAEYMYAEKDGVKLWIRLICF